GIKSFNQRRGALEVGKERSNSLALAVRSASGFQRSLFSQDALGQVWRRIAGGRLRPGRLAEWGRCGLTTPSPDQDLPGIIDRHPLPVDQVCFECLQTIVIELELIFERLIREPATLLQQRSDLVDDLIQVHHCLSASSSSNALASCRSLVSKPSVNQP